MLLFGQKFASMPEPTKDLYRLLMEGQVIHGGGHLTLRWMVDNVVVDTYPTENFKVAKS